MKTNTLKTLVHFKSLTKYSHYQYINSPQIDTYSKPPYTLILSLDTFNTLINTQNLNILYTHYQYTLSTSYYTITMSIHKLSTL